MTNSSPLAARNADHLRKVFLWQAVACGKLNSALYRDFLTRAADDIGHGTIMDHILAAWTGNPDDDLPALRWAGGLHMLALDGRAPELARHFPSCGGRPDLTSLLDDARAVQIRHRDFLVEFMKSPPQTNEVQRSAMLVPGLHFLARHIAPEMELLELGSSAGLNQFPDRVWIDYGERQLGPIDGDIRLTAKWHGPPIEPAPPRITARSGCDLNPINAADPSGAMRLQAYLWPDQLDRLQRLRSAIAVASLAPPAIEKCAASDFLRRRLALPRRAKLTVIFHSYVWSYLPEPERAAIRNVIADAGNRADDDHALAWLRLEDDPSHKKHFLSTIIWPGRHLHVLAGGSPHGYWLEWLGQGPDAAVDPL